MSRAANAFADLSTDGVPATSDQHGGSDAGCGWFKPRQRPGTPKPPNPAAAVVRRPAIRGTATRGRPNHHIPSPLFLFFPRTSGKGPPSAAPA